MSESQERMCAIVEPQHVDRFLEICEKWDVIATVIGEVTDGSQLEIFWHGEQIVDVPRARSPTTARSTTARSPARPGRTRSRRTTRASCPGRRTAPS